jgi:hypothetical protein
LRVAGQPSAGQEPDVLSGDFMLPVLTFGNFMVPKVKTMKMIPYKNPVKSRGLRFTPANLWFQRRQRYGLSHIQGY